MKFKKSRLVSLSNLEFNFFIVWWSKLKLHYCSYMISNIKNNCIVRIVLKNLFLVIKMYSKNEVEKLAIWRHFFISGKYRVYPFLIIVLCSS